MKKIIALPAPFVRETPYQGFKKSFKKLLFSVLVLLVCSVQGLHAQGIVFLHDLDEALAKAKAENKMVFIDFYTSWCGPCKVMSNEVFTLASVGSYFNSQFINCKVQCDDKGKGDELGKKYQVNAYPTLMFVDKNGMLVHSGAGSRSAEELIELANVALNPEKNLQSITKQWDSGKRDKEFVLSYFKHLKEAFRYDKAKADFSDYFNKLSDKGKTDKSTFELIKLVGAEPFSPLFNYVEANKSKYYKSTGKNDVDGFISRGYLYYLQSLAINGPQNEYDEAMQKFKAKKYAYAEEFEMFCSVYLAYKSKNDIKAYMDRGTEFLAKYGKNNDSYTLRLASLLGNYTTGPNQGAAGILWMEDLLKRNPDPRYMDTYFYVLWRNSQLDKALEVGKQMRETAIKNNQPTESIDKQIEMVKGIKAKAIEKEANKNKS
jgi:thiol-disulfide isomerase/thioredoxin